MSWGSAAGRALPTGRWRASNGAVPVSKCARAGVAGADQAVERRRVGQEGVEEAARGAVSVAVEVEPHRREGPGDELPIDRFPDTGEAVGAESLQVPLQRHRVHFLGQRSRAVADPGRLMQSGLLGRGDFNEAGGILPPEWPLLVDLVERPGVLASMRPGGFSPPEVIRRTRRVVGPAPRFNEAGGILPPECRRRAGRCRRHPTASMRPGGFSPRSAVAFPPGELTRSVLQ